MELIKVGKITTSFGIKGEVKVKSESSCLTKKFKKDLYIYLNEELVKLNIESIKGTDEKKIVKFKQFTSLNDVEKIKNVDIFVAEEDLPELEEDEFYLKDLIGLPCFVNGVEIAKVEAVQEMPQAIYLVITINKKQKLIPFIDEFVDDYEDHLVIKPIEGLL